MLGCLRHDAHELLAFLLDALHEDINRAPYPPVHPETGDSSGKTEEEIAAEMWAMHLCRNDSKILACSQRVFFWLLASLDGWLYNECLSYHKQLEGSWICFSSRFALNWNVPSASMSVLVLIP